MGVIRDEKYGDVEYVLSLMHDPSHTDRYIRVYALVYYVTKCFNARDVESVNSLYARLPLVTPLGESAAFLRCGFRARHYMPAWFAYRDAVHAAMLKATPEELGGHTPQRWLRGLL